MANQRVQKQDRPKRRCQAIEVNGKQCRAAAFASLVYYGSEEHYDWANVRCVRVYVCRKHEEDMA